MDWVNLLLAGAFDKDVNTIIYGGRLIALSKKDVAELFPSHLPSNHVIVKLDFSNAFNCIRRDLILDAVAAKTPGLYRLVHSAYSCEPVLAFGDHQILSSERAQQADPLGSLQFCEAIHPLLCGLQSGQTWFHGRRHCLER